MRIGAFAAVVAALFCGGSARGDLVFATPWPYAFAPIDVPAGGFATWVQPPFPVSGYFTADGPVSQYWVDFDVEEVGGTTPVLALHDRELLSGAPGSSFDTDLRVVLSADAAGAPAAGRPQLDLEATDLVVTPLATPEPSPAVACALAALAWGAAALRRRLTG